MFLLDTNILSELRKARRADPNVLAWANHASSDQMFVSVITLMELEIGVLRLEHRDPAQAMQLRAWFTQIVRPSFVGRTLHVTEEIALRAAQLHVPDPQPERDAIIAATALMHNLTVVTRNVSDFLPTGVRVLNPFESTTKETRL
jgi:predicted nucleic acid-binding protein